MKKKYAKIPFESIVKASDGDTESINQVVQHYGPYIGKLSLRSMKDEYGHTCMIPDETLRGRIQTSLIQAILSFDIE